MRYGYLLLSLALIGTSVLGYWILLKDPDKVVGPPRDTLNIFIADTLINAYNNGDVTLLAPLKDVPELNYSIILEEFNLGLAEAENSESLFNFTEFVVLNNLSSSIENEDEVGEAINSQGIVNMVLADDDEEGEFVIEKDPLVSKNVSHTYDSRLVKIGDDYYLSLRDLKFDGGKALIEYESGYITLDQDSFPMTYSEFISKPKYKYTRTETYLEPSGIYMDIKYTSYNTNIPALVVRLLLSEGTLIGLETRGGFR